MFTVVREQRTASFTVEEFSQTGQQQVESLCVRLASSICYTVLMMEAA
jgi:hypothetical protein